MKQYRLREDLPTEAKEELSGYSERVQRILFHRGLDSKAKAQTFFNPSYEEHTHDPFEIAGMDKAVERILRAIKEDEHICIWSDYDHDGIPGGVILYEFFKKIGYKHFRNYIPHRYTEGYGLNTGGIESLAKDGVTLVITVDSGITDVEPVARAKELGVDVIITDHHLTNGTLPDAYTILNSKQDHCDYPFDMLCGAAVAFKLVQALIARGKFDIPVGWEKWLLDLVGLSTIADMVPLQGENRVLAHYGLTVLRKTRRPGLRALLSALRIQSRFLTEDDVGFMIAPRINAASRMAEPRLAFDLLSADEAAAPALAAELEKLNKERKGVVGSMVREMKGLVRERNIISPVIVLGNPAWRPGLLGLAANSVMEEFGKPVFLWGREGGETLKGSCRSPGINLVQLMQAVRPGVFIEFGGHSVSGGFSVSQEEVHYLPERLTEAYEKSAIKNADGVTPEYIDGHLSLNDVNEALWREIATFAPFGIGNPKPVFMFPNVSVLENKLFGKEGTHLSLMLQDEWGARSKAIQFFTEPKKFSRGTTPMPGETISVIGTLEKSYFGRAPELRIRIADIL